MTTRTIKRRRDDESLPPDWQAPAEHAPSILRGEEANAPRVIAMLALVVALVGALAMVLQRYGSTSVLGQVIGFGWGLFLVLLGMAGLLYHAFNEADVQYRRLYGLFGGLLLGLGVVFSLLPADGQIGAFFLSSGAPCLGLALCFLLSYARNESDETLHRLTLRLVGVVAVLLVAVGVFLGIVNESFLMGQGVLYLLLGFLYAAAYIGVQPAASDSAYYAGLAVGAVGLLMIVLALGHALPLGELPYVGPYLGWINMAFGFVRWPSNQPGAPFLFTYVGLEYLLLAYFVCSDSQLAAMTRREFAAYFYSPIAYMVLVAVALLAGLSFYVFAGILTQTSTSGEGLREPVLYYYFWWILLPLFAVVLVVPIITMRLLSEEQRSGTLEVLLTSPVNESTVVLSKFLAGLRFFLLTWYPWAIYLIALRVEGGAEFDYRALLSFALALVAMGSGFVAIGLFFSSLTRNQIIAAILTLVAMLVPLILYMVRGIAFRSSPFWSNALSFVSFVDLWDQASQGIVAPRYLIFHLSLAAFFLYLTVKVLESRKWR